MIAECPAYAVEELTLRTPSGDERTKPVVRHPGSVVIVPVLEQPGRSPKVILVRNERHALGARLDELPAGGIDEGETAAEAAERELREETGYEATSLYELGGFHTSPGMTDEFMRAFVAVGLRQVGQDLEEDEALVVRVVPSGELLGGIDRGEIRDMKTIAATLLAVRQGYLE